MNLGTLSVVLECKRPITVLQGGVSGGGVRNESAQEAVVPLGDKKVTGHVASVR